MTINMRWLTDRLAPNAAIARRLGPTNGSTGSGGQAPGSGGSGATGPAAHAVSNGAIEARLKAARDALDAVVIRLRRGVPAVANDLELVAGLRDKLKTLVPRLSEVEVEFAVRRSQGSTNEPAFLDKVDHLIAEAREVHSRATMIGDLGRSLWPLRPVVCALLSILALVGLMEWHPERPDRISSTEQSRLIIARAAVARARVLSARAVPDSDLAIAVATTQGALRAASRMLSPVLGQLERGAVEGGGAAYGQAAALITGVAMVDSAWLRRPPTASPKELRRYQLGLLASIDVSAFDSAMVEAISTTPPHQHLTWHLLVGVSVLGFLLSSSALIVAFGIGNDASLAGMFKDIFDKTLAKSTLGAAALTALAVGGPALTAFAAGVFDHKVEAPSKSNPPPTPADSTKTGTRTVSLTDSLAVAIDASVGEKRPLGRLLQTVDQRTRADSIRVAGLSQTVDAMGTDVRHVRTVADSVRRRLGPATGLNDR